MGWALNLANTESPGADCDIGEPNTFNLTPLPLLELWSRDNSLKGHRNEADFLGFCINRFGKGPLHYISSHSDFSFQFSEIFVIEKRLAESGVDKIAYRYNFFKPLNKSIVILYYIPGFFFAKLIF